MKIFNLFKTFYYIIIYMYISLRFIMTKKIPIVQLEEIKKHLSDNLEHLQFNSFTTKDGIKANIISEQKINHKIHTLIGKKKYKIITPKGKTKYQDYVSLN